MRLYNEGESFYNIIKSAIPDFAEAEFPLFVEFVSAYLRFLEAKRTFTVAQVFPDFGAQNNMAQKTAALGGTLYETRKLLEYRDTATTLDEFTETFIDMFAKNFPCYSYVTLDTFIASLRGFYRAKGTVDSIEHFFRTLFNRDVEVYFPRTDVLKASDGTWSSPYVVKVTTPTDGHLNSDVAKFYSGQRVQTATGTALVESVITYIVGQAFNQNLVVNELRLKFDALLGTFEPGQTVINVDTDEQVATVVLPQIVGVLVEDGGSNYAVGDLVTFSEGPTGGAGYGAAGLVTKVSNTALNGVEVVEGGNGYIAGTPVTFTSTTGSGATAVVQDIYFGDILLEDGSGYLSLETQTPDQTNRIQLEDVNVLFLELVIDPFCNSTATIAINNADYGSAAGVTQLDGVSLDSSIEIALAATDTKPFMIPWVFTSSVDATLANAAAVLTLTTNTSFINAASVYALTSLQDLTSNLTNSLINATVIVSDVAQGGLEDTLYLNAFTGLNHFDTTVILKQDGTGIIQPGTLTCDGTANVVGSGTSFVTAMRPNSHVRAQNGVQFVVRQVVNNTFLTAFSSVATVTANTFGILPVGTVTSVTAQQQPNYGKIRSVRLLNNGNGYQTPPVASADSVDARAQELFYLDPTSYSQTVLNDLAQGFWRLFGNAGDSALTPHNGSVTGTVTFGQSGPLSDGSTAALFDGATGFISVPDTADQNPGLGDYSYEVWVKRAAGIAASEFVICKAAGAGVTGGGGELFISSAGAFTSRLGAKAVTSASGFADGNWHHVVVTMKRTGTGQMYVDGVASGAAIDISTETAVNLSGAALPLLFGKRPTGNLFTGTLADIAIYSYALSAAQVTNHYALRTASQSSGFVAAGGRVHLFTAAQLLALQDSGQVTLVQITNGGVAYTDPMNVQALAIHGAPRTGSDADLTVATGGLVQAPGEWTTTRGFLSADKFLQDSTFYNDYTYVIRVAESFDKYRALLLTLLHPAGFKALGQFVDELDLPLTLPNSSIEVRRCGYRDRVLLDGPVAYWRLDETVGPTVADAGVNGFTGTIVGGVTLQQTGALADGDTAARFDGVSTTVINTFSDAAVLVPTNGWSLEAWFKQGGANGGVIITRANSRPALLMNGGAASLIVVDGSSVQVQLNYNVTIFDGQWHHLCGTYDGVSLRLYVDSVLRVGPTVCNAYGVLGSQVWRLGGRTDGAIPCDGFIDEPAIYPYALTAGQVAAHYNLRLAPRDGTAI